jgi:hypothetical protein
MSIQFPVVPNVPGVPPLASFPGARDIVASISGNVLTVTSGFGSVAQGLSLSGLGVDPSTVVTSGLQSITTGLGSAIPSGIATALVNIPQSVNSIAMNLTGSLGDLLPDVGDLLDGDTVDAQVSAGPTRWGIFRDGQAVIEPDSIVAVDYKKDWHISDYPIESGSFESYNKVRLPYEARVTMTKGGTEEDRTTFLSTLEQIAASRDLYDVVTPEYTYASANITHFDLNQRRADTGVSLLTVTIWLQEVRIEASSEFTNTSEPSAVDQVNVGVVQAQAVAQQAVQSVKNYITSGAW